MLLNGFFSGKIYCLFLEYQFQYLLEINGQCTLWPGSDRV